jgi:hypothetical protein
MAKRSLVGQETSGVQAAPSQTPLPHLDRDDRRLRLVRPRRPRPRQLGGARRAAPRPPVRQRRLVVRPDADDALVGRLGAGAAAAAAARRRARRARRAVGDVVALAPWGLHPLRGVVLVVVGVLVRRQRAAADRPGLAGRRGACEVDDGVGAGAEQLQPEPRRLGRVVAAVPAGARAAALCWVGGGGGGQGVRVRVQRSRWRRGAGEGVARARAADALGDLLVKALDLEPAAEADLGLAGVGHLDAAGGRLGRGFGGREAFQQGDGSLSTLCSQ